MSLPPSSAPSPDGHLPDSRVADAAGIALSFACLVHCLALPMALLLAPALAAWIILPDGFHAAILILVVPAALIAMRAGWRRHRRWTPTLLAAAGLVLLLLGLAAHEALIPVADPEAADRLLTTLGALTLASAHLINWRRGVHPAAHD